MIEPQKLFIHYNPEIVYAGLGGEMADASLKTLVTVVGFAQMATEIAVNSSKPVYYGVKEWANMTKAGSKFATRLGIVGVALTGVDAVIQGEWKNHHTADALIGTALTVGGFIPGINVGIAVVGGAYFIADFAWQRYSGKSITESLFD